MPWRRKWRLPKQTGEISPPHPPGPDFAPHGVVVKSISGNTELLVTWQQEPGELQEHVVDWIRDGDPSEDLNWVRLPPGNRSAVLPGEAEGHLDSHLSFWRTGEARFAEEGHKYY